MSSYPYQAMIYASDYRKPTVGLASQPKHQCHREIRHAVTDRVGEIGRSLTLGRFVFWGWEREAIAFGGRRDFDAQQLPHYRRLVGRSSVRATPCEPCHELYYEQYHKLTFDNAVLWTLSTPVAVEVATPVRLRCGTLEGFRYSLKWYFLGGPGLIVKGGPRARNSRPHYRQLQLRRRSL